MSIGKRLKTIIDLSFESQNLFSNLTGVDKTTLSRYIHDKLTPRSDCLIKFIETGISIDWLLTGFGSMFADNIAGNKLREQCFEKDMIDPCSPIGRIRYWVEDNYFSLKHFCIALNYDYQKALKIFEDNFIIDPNFFLVLRRSGCNLEWIANEMGEPYTTCPVGSFLKLKHGTRNKFASDELTLENSDEGPFFTEKQLNQLNTLPRIMTVLKGIEYEKKITE